jgi:hypothetical protein
MDDYALERRRFLLAQLRLIAIAPLLSAVAASVTDASTINQRETFVLPPDQIHFQPWGNLPPGSGEMAKLYSDFDKAAGAHGRSGDSFFY